MHAKFLHIGEQVPQLVTGTIPSKGHLCYLFTSKIYLILD